MRSAIALILLASDAQGHAEDMVAHDIGDAKNSMDRLADRSIDKMFDRAAWVSPFSHADLDQATLAKPGQPVMSRPAANLSPAALPARTANSAVKRPTGASGFFGFGGDGKKENTNAAKYKDKLTPKQFYVAYQKGTEPAFANEYHNSKAKGLYKSIAAEVPLFSSDDKFDSGTGWPSFVKPVEGSNVQEVTDTSIPFMPRTEVVSGDDDVHLGHVFPDGPRSRGGMRYCINSAALKFVPYEELSPEEQEKYFKK